MDFLPTLLGLAGMHLLMAMLPGPNAIVVSWYAATRSRSDGLRAVAGVVAATVLWVVLALWGVGTLLLEAGWLYRVVRLLGAAYLVYVAWRLFRAGLSAGNNAAAKTPKRLGRGPFTAGIMTTLSNPKSAVFWTSVFLVAVPPEAPAWVYAAIVGIVALQSSLWYGLIVIFFSTGFARKLYLRIARYVDFLTAGVMVFLGLRLAEEVRREIWLKATA